MLVTLAERAFQTSTSTSAASSSSDTPFFPNPSSLVPPTQTSVSSNKEVSPKSVLEWLFFVVALVLIGTLVTCRSWQLRRRNRPFNQFFSITQPPPPPGRPRRISRTTGLPPLNEPLRPISLTHSMLYPPVSPLPAAYRADRRRTRAADIDEGGRRAGNPGDGNLDHKEMLPAYDNVGGPPKYVEMNIDARTPVHLDLSGVVERAPVNDTPRHGQDTPTQSAEEVASSSHSHHSRHSSTHSEANLR